MSVRIGIFICECGPNIKEAIHLDELCDFGRRLKGVVFVEKYNLLCSGEGTAWLQQTIKEHDLDRIVVARLFAQGARAHLLPCLQQSGRNPYMMQMVNIREQCAWVTRDRGAATRKAGNLLRAAVNRVVHHDPLETRQIECNADVLVVGAGVAGVSAALTPGPEEQAGLPGGEVTLHRWKGAAVRRGVSVARMRFVHDEPPAR